MIVLRARSIRFRITMLATAVVATVLIGAAIALVVTQRAGLTDNLDSNLDQQIDVIVGAIGDGETDQVFGRFAASGNEDRAVQLVADDGRVIAASPNLDGDTPIAEPPDGRSAHRTLTDLPIEDDRFRVASRRIDTADGPRIIHLAENADDVFENTSVLVTSLAVVIPLAVAVLAAVMWWLVGRTLEPVESMRAEVADIGAAELHRRVPQPDTDDEIGRLARTMNAMLDRLQHSATRQQRFVSDASHELRSPLTRMRTALEVELSAPDDHALRDTQASVLEETIELEHLVDDLLHLARSDAGANSTEPVPLDLDDIVMHEAENSRQTAAVDIDTSAVSAGPTRGDRAQLRRLVRNLLDNATRHANSTVSISLRADDDQVRLVVADDGEGIPVERRSELFERFSRIDDARTRTSGGTGLGLAIVEDIVDRHGGTVAIEDSPAGGAAFVVVLPAAD